MARLLGPDGGSRMVILPSGVPAATKVGTVYTDSAGTVLADILAYQPANPTVPGAALAGSQVTTDAYGMLPLFWFPDGLIDRLWISVASGPLTPIDSDYNGRLDTAEAAISGKAATVHGHDPNPGFTHTIRKTAPGGVITYTAVRADGTTASTSTDSASPLRSGLRTVLVAILANNVSIYFPAGTYAFVEDPAGVEDHVTISGITGLALQGDPSGGTILSNWRDDSQPGYDPLPDVEPFSFTRSNDVVYRNFRVWAGGNQDANNSSDALDFDSCRGTIVERVIVERSRARGIVMDGGDSGAISRNSQIRGCEVRGVPSPPNVFAGTAGSLASQQYRYVVTYVDSIYGETPPSGHTTYLPSGTVQARLIVATGPAFSATKGVTSRKIYRWSAAQPTYRLLATIADNTTTIYNDNVADAAISAAATISLTGTPLVPKEGIKLLGSQRHLVVDNSIIGVGSHGIQLVRKGSTTADNVNSDGHRVVNNVIRRAGAGTATASISGVYIGGGSNNTVLGNNISNIGAVAALGLGVQLQGLTAATTDYNAIGPNVIQDDQDANVPSGGATTRYGISLTGTPAPDNTVIVPGVIRGMVTAQISDAGTVTRQYAETTHTHVVSGSSAAPGWKTGLYYGARSSMAHGTLAGQVLTADQAFAAPVYVPQTVTVTTIACNITAAVAAAKLRMAIYTSKADGRPDTMVAGSQTADIAATTTGDKPGTISAVLTGGSWYWLAAVSDQAITVNGFTGGQPNVMGSVGPGSATKQSAVRASIGAAWTVLPATFPAAPSDTAVTLTTEVTF